MTVDPDRDRTMGVIPTRYSPVHTEPDGRVTVELAGDHPGVTDPVYRARRDHLAGLAAAWVPGQPVPTPDYTDQEHGVWREVSASLESLHEQYACRAFLNGKDAIQLPTERVPQLTEVTARLQPVAGFRYHPVAGLAPLRDFYASFAGGVGPFVVILTMVCDDVWKIRKYSRRQNNPSYVCVSALEESSTP